MFQTLTSALKMMTSCSSETLVCNQKSTWRSNPDDRRLNLLRIAMKASSPAVYMYASFFNSYWLRGRCPCVWYTQPPCWWVLEVGGGVSVGINRPENEVDYTTSPTRKDKFCLLRFCSYSVLRTTHPDPDAGCGRLGRLVSTSCAGVPGSNLGAETGYPDSGFRGFSHSLQAGTRIIPWIISRLPPSISFLIHYSLVISFDAFQSELLAASLHK
jgi:hypothetical protein